MDLLVGLQRLAGQFGFSGALVGPRELEMYAAIAVVGEGRLKMGNRLFRPARGHVGPSQGSPSRVHIRRDFGGFPEKGNPFLGLLAVQADLAGQKIEQG